MTRALLLLTLQGVLGAFDTLYFHEWKARLPDRPGARLELRLHAARDAIYAIIFGTLGWVTWNGLLAWLLGGLLLAEVGITLWDFVEEDRTRKLPAGERLTHAVMGIVYGMFIAFLLPEMIAWARRDTGFEKVERGPLAWALTVMAVGVLLSGARDLRASLTLTETRAHPRPLT